MQLFLTWGGTSKPYKAFHWKPCYPWEVVGVVFPSARASSFMATQYADETAKIPKSLKCYIRISGPRCWQRVMSQMTSSSFYVIEKTYSSIRMFHRLGRGEIRSVTLWFSAIYWLHGRGLKLYGVGIHGLCHAWKGSPFPTIHLRNPALRLH